jgi:hypothetical protein
MSRRVVVSMATNDLGATRNPNGVCIPQMTRLSLFPPYALSPATGYNTLVCDWLPLGRRVAVCSTASFALRTSFAEQNCCHETFPFAA